MDQPGGAAMTVMWADLNERQQAYLQALFACDQAEEQARRRSAARGYWDQTPASVWRWQMYGPVSPSSMLYRRLESAKLIDPGTGATWKALETRGQVRSRVTHDRFGGQLLEVQITPAGRKLVRGATGAAAPTRLPKGVLRERQWAALARLYVAGDMGIADEVLMGRGGFDWMQTLLRLRDYRSKSLMESYQRPRPPSADGSWNPPEACCRLTVYGRAYYEREWAQYCQRYPAVEAPRPAAHALDESEPVTEG